MLTGVGGRIETGANFDDLVFQLPDRIVDLISLLYRLNFQMVDRICAHNWLFASC